MGNVAVHMLLWFSKDGLRQRLKGCFLPTVSFNDLWVYSSIGPRAMKTDSLLIQQVLQGARLKARKI